MRYKARAGFILDHMKRNNINKDELCEKYCINKCEFERAIDKNQYSILKMMIKLSVALKLKLKLIIEKSVSL